MGTQLHQSMPDSSISRTPHVLRLMEFAKISQEIKGIQANSLYRVIEVFHDGGSESKEITGRELLANKTRYFDFGHAVGFIQEGTNGGNDTIQFIYTGYIPLSKVQSKVEQLLNQRIIH